jgi:DNA-binding GntR family transcriptional regulator
MSGVSPSGDGQETGRGTLAAVALKSVMTLIRSGELKPGAIVNEVELAKRLGMSRGPVREAVRTLEGRKIVTREPFQRARVSKLDARQIRDVFELREALEGMACRLATQRMSDEALAALASSASVLSPLKTSLVSTDSTVNFHAVIVAACGNERIQASLSADVYDLVRFYRWSSRPIPPAPSGHSHEHWQIVRAMQARDEDLAESLMRSHLRRVRPLIDGDGV